MRALLRQAVLLAVATAVTWLLVWGPHPGESALPRLPEPFSVALAPRTEVSRAVPASERPPNDPPAAEAAAEPSDGPAAPALPIEAGVPEGEERGVAPAAAREEVDEVPEPVAEDSAEEPSEDPPPDAAQDPVEEAVGDAAHGAPADRAPSVHELMADDELLAAAREDLDAPARRGFETVLLAAPEEQLDIARFFGEELVLVPRAALDPEADAPTWFRLDADHEVERVRAPPPLERYRQYRDLFDYEYARLPGPLRELRRSVLARSEVYVFAALVPLREWALVVGRRREALARSGRPSEEVRRFVVRYVRAAEDTYDVHVDEIEFADGQRFHPGSAAPSRVTPPKGGGTGS